MTAALVAGDAPTPRAEAIGVLAGPAGRRARAQMLAGRDTTGETDPRAVYRLLGRHRLLAPNWPSAYGGRGLSATDAAGVVEEMIAAGVSDTLQMLSVQICGAFLLSAGTAAQRAELLPDLAAGRRYCTVLYTEPEVGSDLASLTTQARPRDDGGWAIFGRKVYSVRTTLADIALVAARSSEESTPYQGISLFLVPLDAPGVTVRTVPGLADEAFGDVTLTDVQVGPETVVGPIGGAWPLITEALALERTGVDHVAKATAWLDAWCAEFDPRTVDDPLVAPEIGRLRSRLDSARALSRQCLAQIERGDVDPVLAAGTKLLCSETAADIASTCTRLAHERGVWARGDDAALAGGRLEAAYREAPGLTISAGTSEMMLEVIASAGLPGAAIGSFDDAALTERIRRAVLAVCTSGGPARDAVWSDLAELGAFDFAVPASLGGLGLGRRAASAVVSAAGEAGYDGALLDTCTGIDVQVHAGSTPRGAMLAVVDACRPDRPLTHPGPGGLLVVASGGPWEAFDPDGSGIEIRLLPVDHPAVRLRERRTALGSMHTATVEPGPLRDVEPSCTGAQAAAVLTGDLLRRAAWLTGAGSACLSATVGRTRDRTQFGRALLDNQTVGFRLARLAVRAQALRALTTEIDAAEDSGTGGGCGARAAGALAAAGVFARDAAAGALQLHGAFGLLADSPVAPYYLATSVAIAQGPRPIELLRAAGRLAPPRRQV